MSYKLDKPYTQEQRTNFIKTYCYNNSMRYEATESAIYALEPWEKLVNGEVIDNTQEYKAQQAQKEAERIQELSMTRSDFFDATIKAFGADESDFLPIVENILTQIPETLQIMEDVPNSIAIKIALNNYKNAAGFYRKHPLFMILSNVPIQISETLTITITPKQWDKFFDEMSKKNTEAYKELLPSEGNV